MSFSQEAIPPVRSERSIALHGSDTPFRHHTVVKKYIDDLFNRNGYQDLVEYNTTVERAVKSPESGKWELTLRRGEKGNVDYWWTESFDGLVIATGHYSVPYIPAIPGLKEFAERYPGSVEHTKQYRGPEGYHEKVYSLFQIEAKKNGTDTNSEWSQWERLSPQQTQQSV